MIFRDNNIIIRKSRSKQLQITQTIRNPKYNNQRRPKKFGTAPAENNQTNSGFLGCVRKMWLFINRIQKPVSEKDTQEYIKKKEKIENIRLEVKEIPGNPEGLKRFMVSTLFASRRIFTLPISDRLVWE
ncbi:hypothetical protein HHI36_013374 [Cryptolaemus montrouzieri]|uniref:Uncharacterized protein n=1 Tax=Cryptolaemus montrouzieri TaxID=559131 RepID=A0ABD2NH91_9CUCU